MSRRIATVHGRLAAALTLIVIGTGCTDARSMERGGTALGAEAELGSGTATTYSRFDREGVPLAIGVIFSNDALSDLPTAPSDGHHCFDHDGNGSIEPPECMASHERVIPLPTETSRRPDMPFKWVLLNWNPVGHIPHEVYGAPHFDIHFFIDTIENTFSVVSGPCGEEFVRCDQFERARRPVPAEYMHPDFQDVGAAVPAMGNHLIDLTGAEFHGEPFTRTWIFGAYDGRVTFYEEMVTLEHLLGRPDECREIKSPPAVERAGYYPTRSCLRYDAATGELTASLEAFAYREAAPTASAE